MKASVKTKNKFTHPLYTVMIGKEIIQGFYSKKLANELRDKLNNK